MEFTLVADGSSDKVLLPILTWCLKQETDEPVREQWADFSRIPPQPTLESKVRAALDLYPCDILFVHRDAEAQPSELRREQIGAELRTIGIRHVPVVPIRMTEAWLLFHEPSIRSAAGNPNGTLNLNLPSIKALEQLPDPKGVLHAAIIKASGLSARRRSNLPVAQRIQRIPEYIDDYSPLKVLSAFRKLQGDIRSVLRNQLS